MEASRNPSGASHVRAQGTPAGDAVSPSRPVPAHPVFKTDRSYLSDGTHENSLSDFSNSTLIEQLENRIAGLEEELGKVREAAGIDLQNAHNDLVSKNRQIGQLKSELAGFRDEQPESGEVKELLILWKTLLNKNAKTYIGLEGKRAKVAQVAIKRWGQPRCEKAILGLSLKPWAGPQGRATQQYPGAKRYDDVEHALGDETRLEALEKVAAMYERPTLMDEPVGPAPAPKLVPVSGELEPESLTRQALRDVFREDCKLEHRPASREPKRRVRPWDDRPPVDKVLGALRDRGCSIVAGADADSWGAQCPAHEDRSPSLSVTRKHDGMMLLRCWSGCETVDVLAALGLEFRDLWTHSEDDPNCLDEPRKTVIPSHLRHAMRDLLAMDEKSAA